MYVYDIQGHRYRLRGKIRIRRIIVSSGENKVIKAGIGYTVGNILVKGITFLTIPIFTHLMRTDEYGVYNTYAAYVSIVAVVVSLGLPSSVRNARYDMPDEERRYHINSVSLILLAFSIFFLTAVCLHKQLSNLLGISVSLLLIVVVNSACTALHSYYNNILTIDFRYRQFLKLSFFYSITSVCLSILMIYFKVPTQSSALARAIGNMIPMIAIAIFVLVHVWKRDRIQLRHQYTRYGIRFGIPLIPNDLSSLILAQFDRIMIYRFIGESESGLYSFAYNVAVIYQVVTNSIESAWTPWMFSQLHAKNYSNIKQKTKAYIGLLTLGTGMLALASPEIIMLLSSRAYWDGRTVVVPIIFAMYFFAVATIPVGIEFYHKKTGWISFCTFFAAICNIVLNFVLIPRYGYQAAAYTTLGCYCLYAIVHMQMAARLEPIALLKMPFVLISVCAMGVFVAISIAALYHPIIRWAIECFILCIVLAVFIRKRKFLMQVLSDFHAARRQK